MAEDDAGVFRALADPTRRQILQDLRDGELAAGDIASKFSMATIRVRGDGPRNSRSGKG